MNTTSISLLERLSQPGDGEAWERFVRIYAPLIFAWARGVGLPAGDAEDLVQDVLSILVEQLPDFRYDPDKSFRGWLRTITTNRCRDHFRRRVMRPRTTSTGHVDSQVSDGADAMAEAEYRRHLAGRALDVMRSEFEPSTWKACFECVVNDRPPREVAAELGISVNAVYVAKSRVLRRLRRELDGLWD
jgi:RNA polymerase sigma-70 factor (ECF subfamily)